MQTDIIEIDQKLPQIRPVRRRDAGTVLTHRTDSDYCDNFSAPTNSFPAESKTTNLEFKFQEGYCQDLTPILTKARTGDHKAFDRLSDRLCPLVRRTLTKQGATPDDAEDAISNAMMIFYRLLSQGRFDAMETGGVIAYFRKVALHEWLHRPSARKNGAMISLVYRDAAGEDIWIEPADTRVHFTEKVENRCLYEFLVKQLDEVFVEDKKGVDRFRGELEKFAFISYYQDNLTQNEIFIRLNQISENCSQPNPVSRVDLNNWLSMGRSLKTLLKHLAEDHTELMGTLVELHLSQLKLPEAISEVLRLVYKDGRDLKQVASRKGIELTMLKRELSIGKKALVEVLARTIKSQLHLSRFGVQ